MLLKSIKSFLPFLIFIMSLLPEFSFSQPGNKQSLIPGGEFSMGTEEGTLMEHPVHRVQLENFYIDRHEVSNKEYESFHPDHQRSVLSACDKCPVTMVNWHDADAFCKYRGARLPTEAEWERAARGTRGYSFSFGATADMGKGRFGLPFKAGAAPVNSSQPNDFGLYHMSGNVWEWVGDWSAPYQNGALKNPVGPPSGEKKILRGGSWYNASFYMNVGLRFELNPKVKLNSIGFRCVKNN